MEPEPRRNLLRWLLGGGLSASLISFLYPAFKFMNPPDIPEASVNEVAAGKVQDLKPNSGKIVKFGSLPVILVRASETEWQIGRASCRERVEGAVGAVFAEQQNSRPMQVHVD